MSNDCNWETTTCCISCQIWFADIQLYSGHIYNLCKGKRHFDYMYTLVIGLECHFLNFQWMLVSNSWTVPDFPMVVLNFWYLLPGMVHDCGGPVVLTWAPPCCHWADWCSYLRYVMYCHNIHRYYCYLCSIVLCTCV